MPWKFEREDLYQECVCGEKAILTIIYNKTHALNLYYKCGYCGIIQPPDHASGEQDKALQGVGATWDRRKKSKDKVE